MDGDLTTGVLASFVLYTVTVGFSLQDVSSLYADCMKAFGSSERVFALLERTPLIPIEGGRRPFELRGEVRFDRVSFRYPSRDDVVVLKNFSLTLKPGTITALVGPSGSGKSTCVALIERFYDLDEPGSGRILIDGVDIRELDPSWIHQHIALVSQEPVLFASTIKENILVGKPDATDTEIQRACELANAYDFICRLPEGWNTMVGERGVRLSGGQRQRIAIARSLLMNPTILIADEATSSLDAESEFHVQQALERLMRGRTTLVIAHRLSTVANADTVVVMSHGKIQEQGTHSQLIELGGLYAKLVRRQLQPDPHPRSFEPKTLASSLSEDDFSALKSPDQITNL